MRLDPHPSAPWWARSFHAECSTASAALDRAAVLLSAHRCAAVATDADVDAWIARLDDAAAAIPAGSTEPYSAWHRVMFVELGLSGNGIDYHDVRNSFLPDVLDRQVGIPISLAVIGIELARRSGLDIVGISLPGHFLLEHRPPHPSDGERRFVDAFHGGALLDTEGIHDRLRSMFGPDQELDESMLQPATSVQVLVRMLANLKQNYARLRDLAGLRDVLLLRSGLPDVSITEARELARLHHATGDIDAALDVCDQLERAHPQAAALIEGDRRHIVATLN